MKRAEELSRKELVAIVREFQYALSTEVEEQDEKGNEVRVWASNRHVSGSDLVDLAVEVLSNADLLSSDAQDGQVVHELPETPEFARAAAEDIQKCYSLTDVDRDAIETTIERYMKGEVK